MSCITCEVTPPAEKTSPDRVGEHHIGQRFGDSGIGLAVLWRGVDVTRNCVEAHAGPAGSGWVEVRIASNDDTPVIHPAAPRTCPDCRAERADEHPDEDGCPDCGSLNPTVRAWPAHAATTVRHGPVVILRGSEIVNGPPADGATFGPSAESADSRVRQMISRLYESHPELREQQTRRESDSAESDSALDRKDPATAV